MEIVPQFQSFSYSLFSPYPLLPAPAPRPLLNAPKIAGLLPAKVAAPFTDTIMLRDDPTPPPFVSKDKQRLPPAVLKIMGHIPAPDEIMHDYEMRCRETAARHAALRREYELNPQEFMRRWREEV